MERQEKLTQLLYDVIAEVNETLELDPALERSMEAVLIGESSALNSLGFITLVAAVEEQVERVFNETISLMDVVLEAEPTSWTVGDMATCIAELVDGAANE